MTFAYSRWYQQLRFLLLSLAILFVSARTGRAELSAEPDFSAIASLYGRTVEKIDVQGSKRIEREAVVAKLVSKVGSSVSKEALRADVQGLFELGYFDDIEVQATESQGKVSLVYVVQERPAVAKVDFDGNERVSTSDLREVVKVKEWSILDVNKVKEDVTRIQKHYEDKGFYLAKVDFEIQKTSQPDQVELVFKINDFDKVQVKKITFLNNKVFSDEQLKSVMAETREGGLFSFMTDSGNFKETSFKTDLERLSVWYLDHGYLKFTYDNPIVSVSDDKRFLFITIYVNEGDPYKIGSLSFGGDLLFPESELRNDLLLTDNTLFSLSKRNADIMRLTEKYQDLGYAFVNVVPNLNVKDDTKTVDVTWSFEKGNLVYFNEINISGNNKTHDKVIRRELKVQEGQLYNGTRLRESRENVERLGFFAPGEVIFNTISPKGTNDRVNLDITIKERSTGTITLGAGYGSQGFFFQTQLQEANLMGRGQSVSLQAQLTGDAKSKMFIFGFNEPYTFDTKWSTGFNLFYNNYRITNKYFIRKLGFNFRFGYPIFDYTSVFAGYKLEGMNTSTDDEALLPVLPEDAAADNGVLSSLTWSIVRDKRNNRMEPTGGSYQSFDLETAGVGGDKSFVKATANNRFFWNMFGDLVFRSNVEVGHIYPLGGRPVPPSEKFYLGGYNVLRGHYPSTVGPSRKRLNKNGVEVDEPTGGTFEAFSIFELEHPLIKEAGLKMVTFVDFGNTFQGVPNLSEFNLKIDAGFGFRWFSPIGPLRFEWGYTLNKGETPSSNFFFMIGPPF